MLDGALRRLRDDPRVARAFDAAAVLLLLALPFQGWTRAGAEPGARFGSFASDVYLSGPDAASWAQNAQAFADGRYGALDDHRMPTWTLLTGGLMRVAPLDVAAAGHLVNRGLHLGLALAVYALGRALGMRGAALAAAAAVAFHPALLGAAAAFGVDPTVAFGVVLTLLSARAAGRWWGLAPLAGAVGALTAASHLTAVAFWVTGAVMVAATGRGWRRVAAVVLYGVGFAATLRAVYLVFPLMPREMWADVFAEGIHTTAGNTSPAAAAASREAALATLRARAPEAAASAMDGVAAAFHLGMPRAAAWAVLALGVLGPRAVRGGAHVLGVPRWREQAARVVASAGEGLPLLLALAPLVALAAADAPTRYSQNLLPVAALLLARGGTTLCAAIGTLGRRFGVWRADARGVAGLAEAVLAFGVLARDQLDTGPRTPVHHADAADPAEQARRLGERLASRFPPGSGASAMVREPLAYAGLPYCPHTACPMADTEDAFAACLTILQTECPGAGEVAWLAIDGLPPGQETPARRAMSAWIDARLTPALVEGAAKVYALPRAGPLPAGLDRSDDSAR